jgi:hypothetical protein
MNYPNENRNPYGPKAPKRPRKLKKAVQSALIIYDIASFPRELENFEKVTEIFHDYGILLYDSNAKGGIGVDAPRIVGRKNKRLKIVDHRNGK